MAGIDLLLKGGHVIDPENGIDAAMDVAVKDGVVASVAADIPASGASRTIDVSGAAGDAWSRRYPHSHVCDSGKRRRLGRRQ